MMSIAWKVAERAHEEGANFVLTNAPVAMRMGAINDLAEKTGSEVILNHLSRYRGGSEEKKTHSFVVNAKGNVTNTIVSGLCFILFVNFILERVLLNGC